MSLTNGELRNGHAHPVQAPVTSNGACLDHLERKRMLVHKVLAIAGTEYLSVLETMVQLLYEKIAPAP